MTTPRRMSAALACGVALALAAALPCPAQTRPAAGAKPLARYIPATDLVFYVEFDGINAHAAAWKKSALYRVVNETKLGAMVEDLASQFLAQVTAENRDAKQPKPAEITALIRAFVSDGFAFGLVGKPPAKPVVYFAHRNGAKNGAKTALEAIAKRTQVNPKSERRGSRSILVHPSDDGPAWWYEGDDLVVAFQPIANAEAVIAAIDGKAPSAATSPIRNDLMKPDGFETVGLAFLDFAKIPMPPDAAKLGLDGLKRIDYRVGFQDDALMSVARVLAPSPRRGALALLESPTFDKSSLPPIPAGLTSFTVFSLNPATFYDRIKGIAAASNPNSGQQFAAFEQGVQQNLNIRLKEDLLGQLGPKWVFYLNGEAPPPGQPIGKIRSALTAEVRDSAAFAATLDKVMNVVTQVMQAQAQQNPRGQVPQIRKAEGPTPGYRLILPPGSIPPQAAGIVDPTILVGKRQFVLALSGAEARAAVTGAKTWTPGLDYTVPFSKLPKDLIALGIDDPRAIYTPLIANAPTMVASLNAAMAAQAAQNPAAPKLQLKLDPSKVPSADDINRRLFPNTMAVVLDREGLKVTTRESIPGVTGSAGAGVAVALLLPAVQAAREAARRAQCVNDLKQIGLALHNYHSTNDAFPPQAIKSKDGKPLLSWRVAILPYIEEQELYNQFKLDEPWDSPNNKPLIAKMPKTYTCPSRARVEPGTTSYKAFAGPGTLFDPARKVGMRDVTDGTSLTLAVVEGKTPVIWTKPEDIPFDPKAKPSLLDAGSNHPGGFNALIADGSVRFIKNSIAVQVFWALITRAGGEVVQFGSF